MDKYFFHPLGLKNYKVQPTTYENHGVGKLDFGGANMPLYAMADGEITFCGMYADGSASACVLKTSQSGLDSSIYIRYLHGRYVVSVGDRVKQGDLLGYSDNIGYASSGAHLHLDFCWGNFGENGLIGGTVSSDRKHFTVNGKSYSLINDIDWTKVENWRTINGGSLYGYCWLVMASKGVEKQVAKDSLGITGQQFYDYCQGHTWPYPFGIGSIRMANGIVNFANALIKVGFNKGAAISIAANGLMENLSNCLDDTGNACNWGQHIGPEGDIDCGINAFHTNGNAYTQIVKPNYFKYLQNLGYTLAQCESGSFEIQAMITYLIVNHRCGPNRFFERYEVNSITTYETSRTIKATRSIQQSYQNDYNKFFVNNNNDVEMGALMFERMYECSAGYANSLQARCLCAYLLAKCSGVI